LGRLIRDAKPDIVHCLHFPTPLPSRTPLVVTLHDLIPLVEPDAMPSMLKRSIYRCWNSRAVHRADLVLVPSRATAADVVRLSPKARDKLRVIGEAADDFSAGPMAPLSGVLAQAATGPYLFSMGNTKPHKDLPTLLRAFQQLAESRPELRLVLAGVDSSDYLQKHLDAARPGLRSRVAFTGRISDEQLRTLYAGATVFVFPSRYEGFGLPVLEAMALGAPVVCTEAASLSEVAGDAALLVPPGDPDALANAITRTLDNEALRSNLVLAGRLRAAQFSWRQTAAETVAAYREVLTLRRRTSDGREGGDR
jgi:glycosyltransferase involved in cell wall biosynthesis